MITAMEKQGIILCISLISIFLIGCTDHSNEINKIVKEIYTVDSVKGGNSTSHF